MACGLAWSTRDAARLACTLNDVVPSLHTSRLNVEAEGAVVDGMFATSSDTLAWIAGLEEMRGEDKQCISCLTSCSVDGSSVTVQKGSAVLPAIFLNLGRVL